MSKEIEALEKILKECELGVVHTSGEYIKAIATEALAPYNKSNEEGESFFLHDTINNEMVELSSIKDAEKYTRDNFTEGNTAHPDYYGFDLFKKVGVIDENCKVLLNSQK